MTRVLRWAEAVSDDRPMRFEWIDNSIFKQMTADGKWFISAHQL